MKKIKTRCQFFLFPVLTLAAVLSLFQVGITQANGDEKPSSIHSLAYSSEWLKLLHYNKKLFGGYESIANGNLFFLSPEGQENPLAELQADITALTRPPKSPDSGASQDLLDPSSEKNLDAAQILKLHALCRFPARATFLKEKLGLTYPEVKCAHLEVFRKIMSPISASIVFSSFYLGSPSSTFGHTFIRINSERAKGFDGKHHELLDNGINFAANINVSNPLLYSIYGLIGFFQGTFTALPYYYKVREYNDYESRDLWSYDLSLTKGELDQLVSHLWELGATYYDYYYFKGNCSYHMFTTLEAISPRLHLVELMPFYIIPSDTVRHLNEVPGLVTKVSYRPSARSLFEYRKKYLTPEEQELLYQRTVAKNEGVLKNRSDLSAESKVRVLDTALDYMEYRYPEDILNPKSESSAFKQNILVERAGMRMKSSVDEMVPEESMKPHLSHGVRRLFLNSGYRNSKGAYEQIDYRFAMHDELDPEIGYPENAQIEFGHLSGRYENRISKFRVDTVRLLSVVAIDPITRFRKSRSYRVVMEASRSTDRNCAPDRPDCMLGVLEFGAGAAAQFFERLTPFMMADFRATYGAGYLGSSYKLGLGPRAGALLKITNSLKLEASMVYHYLVFAPNPNHYDEKVEIRKTFGTNWALNFSWDRNSSDAHSNDWAAGGMIYY